jgi:exopolysaccharide biosynthesis protein
VRETAVLPAALEWQGVRPGLETAEFTLEAGRLGVDIRVTVLRIEPQAFEFSLVHQTRANRMTGAWNVDMAPADAAVALNAGQFKETGPWGWVVLDGDELRDPGYGPLSVGVAIDTAGGIHWLPFSRLAAARRDRSLRFAFQSYPTLLLDGRVPELARSARLVDQQHRDARLLLAQDADGRLLVLLTRYNGLGRTAARVPIGLTVPESIALIAALGAQHAVMLDGGVSAQMLVRDRQGAARVWKGMRDVPLALIAVPRAD